MFKKNKCIYLNEDLNKEVNNGYSLAIDKNGFIYVTGVTWLDLNCVRNNGKADGYILKYNPNVI